MEVFAGIVFTVLGLLLAAATFIIPPLSAGFPAVDWGKMPTAMRWTLAVAIIGGVAATVGLTFGVAGLRREELKGIGIIASILIILVAISVIFFLTYTVSSSLRYLSKQHMLITGGVVAVWIMAFAGVGLWLNIF